jgi:hypothetical protein
VAASIQVPQNRLCCWAPTSSASCRLARLRTTAAGESSVNACVNRSKRRRRRVKSHHVRVRAPPTLLVHTSECGDSSHRVLFSLHIRRRARSMLAARIHRYRCLREVTESECKRSRTVSPHTHHSGVSKALAMAPECRACDVCPFVDISTNTTARICSPAGFHPVANTHHQHKGTWTRRSATLCFECGEH